MVSALLCVLPVVYRVWASARMVQLEDWFKSWVPDLGVKCWGGGVGALLKPGILLLWISEEVLAGAVDSHVHVFVADVVKSFDKVDREILDRVFLWPWFACLV